MKEFKYIKVKRKKVIKKKKNRKKVMDRQDPHIGCFSYPECDEAPGGCQFIMGSEAEPYGHRD